MENGKPWYLSKTIWVNSVLGLAMAVYPDLKQYMDENVIIAIFVVANLILRVVTKDTVQIS